MRTYRPLEAIRHVLAALMLGLMLTVSPASATSYSTDQSDLWWIPAESGWGFQIVQRGSVIFLTMFVYGSAGGPTWYVATLNPTSPGSFVWDGDLYTANGPWFATVPYDPALFTARKVGSMRWTPQTPTSGRLEYAADGVAVTKNVVRQTLVADDYGGTYLGAFHDTTTGCTNPANNVPPSNDPDVTITVTQSGQSVGIVLSHPGWFISITGMLTQSGQLGSVSGTYSSSAGEVGNANISAMNVQANSVTGDFSLTSTSNGCQNTGYFSGMRAS